MRLRTHARTQTHKQSYVYLYPYFKMNRSTIEFDFKLFIFFNTCFTSASGSKWFIFVFLEVYIMTTVLIRLWFLKKETQNMYYNFRTQIDSICVSGQTLFCKRWILSNMVSGFGDYIYYHSQWPEEHLLDELSSFQPSK